MDKKTLELYGTLIKTALEGTCQLWEMPNGNRWVTLADDSVVSEEEDQKDNPIFGVTIVDTISQYLPKDWVILEAEKTDTQEPSTNWYRGKASDSSDEVFPFYGYVRWDSSGRIWGNFNRVEE